MAPDLTPDLTRAMTVTSAASREAAFAHSIAAAGVVMSVARSCRDGQLASCGCSQAARPDHLDSDWVWGGCGDNIHYGYRSVRETMQAENR